MRTGIFNQILFSDTKVSRINFFKWNHFISQQLVAIMIARLQL
jgi:hypothetical protein